VVSEGIKFCSLSLFDEKGYAVATSIGRVFVHWADLSVCVAVAGGIELSFILEGIVTTRNPDGSINVAPMGPVVVSSQAGEISRLLFRPFQDSQTCQNLLSDKQGVFHLTDDVLLFSQAVTKTLNPDRLSFSPAQTIDGMIIKHSCSWYEFQIIASETSSVRVELEADVLKIGTDRTFFGFNRAKHAVIEAAILATRLHLLDMDFILEELQKFQILVDKTAGARDVEAFDLLCRYIREHADEPGPMNLSNRKLLDQGEE